MPDIDVDFEPEGRQAMIEYMSASKWCRLCGADRNLGTLAARGVIRMWDV